VSIEASPLNPRSFLVPLYDEQRKGTNGKEISVRSFSNYKTVLFVSYGTAKFIELSRRAKYSYRALIFYFLRLTSHEK